MTFNNILISCFSNNRYYVTIQILTPIVNSLFLIEMTIFNRFLNNIDVLNQLPITLGTALVCNKISNVKNLPLQRTISNL